ncbi:MAG TPA: Ig-like domain-containing protein, partial [Verrucomicrobiae bacterium]|nr:Ig-like domain-containing protein [Verrucomicrobiae bacterium]
RYQQASVLKTEVETIAGTPAAGLKTGGPFKITNATPLSKFLFWCAVPIFGCYFFLLLNDHFNGTNQKLWHYFSYVFLTFAVVCGVDTIIRIRRTLRAKSSAAGQELHRISRTMLISGTLAAAIVLYFVAWPAFHKNHDSTKAAIAAREPVPMAANTNGPAVVEVSPADGATNVDPVQELRIRFDQPMNPADMWLDWRSGGFLPRGFPRYDTARNEFVIPVRLQPGATNQLSLNWAERGFRNFDSIPAREFHWQFITRPAPIAPGAGKPRVVRISPGTGTTLPVLTQFEITFDRPMTPPDERSPYLKKVGWFDTLPTLLPDVAYDAASNRFIVPVILAPDNETRLTLLGFNSAEGVASDPVVISCVTGTNNLSAAQMAEITAAARDPRLEQLLAAMKTAREQLRSGVETVRTFSFSGTEGSFDRNLSAEAATFKWQGTNQAYADISDVMNCKSFILGNDGSNCWLYAENARNGPRLNRTPTASVAEIQTSIADPFGLMKHPVSFVLERDHLVYCGQEVIDGRTCHRVQSYFVKQSADQPSGISAARMDWWIDTNTFLPVQVVQAAPFGRQIFRFEFRQLNQPLAVTAFQPPANGRAKADEWFEKKLQPEEQRYLTIRDGGNGRMSVRIGRQGQNGSTSSGLN